MWQKNTSSACRRSCFCSYPYFFLRLSLVPGAASHLCKINTTSAKSPDEMLSVANAFDTLHKHSFSQSHQCSVALMHACMHAHNRFVLKCFKSPSHAKGFQFRSIHSPTHRQRNIFTKLSRTDEHETAGGRRWRARKKNWTKPNHDCRGDLNWTKRDESGKRRREAEDLSFLWRLAYLVLLRSLIDLCVCLWFALARRIRVTHAHTHTRTHAQSHWMVVKGQQRKRAGRHWKMNAKTTANCDDRFLK